jgi:hypothetical protein
MNTREDFKYILESSIAWLTNPLVPAYRNLPIYMNYRRENLEIVEIYTLRQMKKIKIIILKNIRSFNDAYN